MALIFADIPALMDESVHYHSGLKGIRLFQLYLNDMIQGGSAFTSSYLATERGKDALAVLDHFLESDPSVPLLLTKSIEKCLVYA